MDEGLQREILERLVEAWPAYDDDVLYVGDDPVNEAAKKKVTGELLYLKQYGLVEFEEAQFVHGAYPLPFNVRITNRGLDFMNPSGGLGKELNVVTVKLHADTIRDMLINRLEANTAVSQAERTGLVEQIRMLPGKALGKLTEALLKQGVDAAVQQLPQLGTLIGQALWFVRWHRRTKAHDFASKPSSPKKQRHCSSRT